MLVERLEDKAPGRVEKVPAAYTSQRCGACGHVARENRESQAVFVRHEVAHFERIVQVGGLVHADQ
jgi:transposase